MAIGFAVTAPFHAEMGDLCAVSSNTAIAEKKPHWIDFNAGALLDGVSTMDQLADELFALILDVASGRERTNNEKHGYREIAIWKEGVTL